MAPYIQATGNVPSFQTSEDVRSMSSGQRSVTTWQGREITHEESGSVLEALSSAYIMAQVLSFLPQADAARSALVCPSFRAAKALVDLEQARSLALTFGFPKEFSFNIQGVPCRPLDESDPIVTRLIQIEQTLPKALRKNNSKEELRTLAQNPTWLRGFLQTAYDNQLLIALGEAAGIDPVQPFAYQVRHVRQWLATSPQITTLCVVGKDLLILPAEVAQLINLHYLNVSNNQLTALPDLSPLTNLKELYVSRNQLTEFPNLSSLANLQSLDVEGNRLTTLPDLSSFANLQRLDVSRNQLTALPDVSPLTNLEALYLDENRLTALPNLSSLTQLIVLFACDNQITELPNLSSLANLQSLDVSRNQLSSLPELNSLTDLEQLYVSRNRLTELPDLHSLVDLQILYVDNTQITRLPDALFQLPQISTIFARENPHLVITEAQQLLLDEFHARGSELLR